MSDKPDDEHSLRAGHPPAMKVGGMRVPQPKVHHEEKSSPPKEEKGKEAEQPNKISPNSVVTVVSGAPVKLKEAFPEEAIRVAHEPQLPTHDALNSGQKVNKPLIQPRRNYH